MTLPSQDYDKLWKFDDASDEEVPAPTMLEAAIRREGARTHVETRLRALRAEMFVQERMASLHSTTDDNYQVDSSTTMATATSKLELTDEGFVLAEAPELGPLCPPSWRTTGYEGILLDRTWLHEDNPFTFDEEGVLREPFIYMKKPKCIPILYRRWLKGEDNIKGGGEKWADGWTSESQTTEWRWRWRDGELTAKEIGGRRREGFVLDVDVVEF